MTTNSLPAKPHGHQLRKHKLPTPEEMRRRFDYNPETGKIWQRTGTKYADRQPVRLYSQKGYNIISLRHNGHELKIRAHRAAFAIMEGRWPHLVDHKNNTRADNRWKNLQEISNRENIQKGQKVRKARYITRAKSAKSATGLTWHIGLISNGRPRSTNRRDFCQAIKVLQTWKAERKNETETLEP